MKPIFFALIAPLMVISKESAANGARIRPARPEPDPTPSAPSYPITGAGTTLTIFRGLSLVEGQLAKKEVVPTTVSPRCVARTPQGCAYSIPEYGGYVEAYVPAGLTGSYYTIWNEDILTVTKGYPKGYPNSLASQMGSEWHYNVLRDLGRFQANMGATCAGMTRTDLCKVYETPCAEVDPVSEECRRFAEPRCSEFKTIQTCRAQRFYIHNPSDNNTTTVPVREIAESCMDSPDCQKYGLNAKISSFVMR